MRRFIVLDKQIGETPLMAIQKWKRKNSIYTDTIASYAGRLDPMASGKLLILLGEECKRQQTYTALDKEYEIEILLDIESDTGDVLGLSSYMQKETHPNTDTVETVLRHEIGAHMRAYPAFSSKTLAGKPLFLHTLEGTLQVADLPKHIEKIYTMTCMGSSLITQRELKTRVAVLLDHVPYIKEPSKRLGENFRINEVRTHWESNFETMGERKFSILRVKVVCASGTYMRSLAGRIGATLGTSGLALSIRRTRIGRYFSFLGTGFWLRAY